MGAESTINETAGLGGVAQAAAFPLQNYQGGSPEEMVGMNRETYEITLAEHPELKIPYSDSGASRSGSTSTRLWRPALLR